MSTIVVTGANGQLGKELQKLASDYCQFDFIFLAKEDLPIHEFDRVKQFFDDKHPEFCINCAAYTAVDKAETEKDAAFLVNAASTGVLAQACSLHHTKFIHISTDYVFDGSSDVPLKEENATAPVNLYGASKLKGEELALQHNPDTIIIRTAWVYSEFGNNFVKTMIRLMNERKEVRVVNDQIGSPTYAADLAAVIMQIISSGKFIPGIYHYSNEGRISWYEFALAIKELINSNCEVIPILSSQYPTAAKRPQFSLLDKTKIKTTYGIDVSDWRMSLIACINKIKKQEA